MTNTPLWAIAALIWFAIVLTWPWTLWIWIGVPVLSFVAWMIFREKEIHLDVSPSTEKEPEPKKKGVSVMDEDELAQSLF